MMTTSQKILHALTDYDRKQQGKPGYNPCALSSRCRNFLILNNSPLPPKQ